MTSTLERQVAILRELGMRPPRSTTPVGTPKAGGINSSGSNYQLSVNSNSTKAGTHFDANPVAELDGLAQKLSEMHSEMQQLQSERQREKVESKRTISELQKELQLERSAKDDIHRPVTALAGALAKMQQERETHPQILHTVEEHLRTIAAAANETSIIAQSLRGIELG